MLYDEKIQFPLLQRLAAAVNLVFLSFGPDNPVDDHTVLLRQPRDGLRSTFKRPSSTASEEPDYHKLVPRRSML